MSIRAPCPAELLPAPQLLSEVNSPSRFAVSVLPRQQALRVGLLALLKIFQCLGCFVLLADVPLPILEYVAKWGYGNDSFEMTSC